MIKKISIILIFYLFLTSVSFAGYTADISQSGVGARPIAMGKAFVGIADGSNAIAFNPAGIGFTPHFEITSMQTKLLNVVDYKMLAGVMATRFGNIGLKSNLNPLDFTLQQIKINEFLDKISDAEMQDILIEDEKLDAPDETSLYTIHVRTNTQGEDLGKYNYRFEFELLMHTQKHNPDYDLIIENIISKLKTKKIYIGYDNTGKIGTIVKKIAPLAVIDKSSSIKRGIIQ